MLRENISRIAKEKGYSIYRLEKECGLARSSIDKWRTVAPSVWRVKGVADFLGVTVDELLTEPEAEEHDVD